MKKKKWFSFLLTAVITISLLPISTWAAGSDCYEVTYVPGRKIQIPLDEFGEDWHGAGFSIFQIDGQDKKTSCSLDFETKTLELVLPWDVDLTTGTYATTITFANSQSGKQVANHKVKLIVEEDVTGSHTMNQVVEIDWDSNIVLHFQNGTGGSRITEISKISFRCMSGGEDDITPGFSPSQSSFTYDLDKGEIYIPKEYFQSRVLDYGWNLLPYVYIGTIDTFTLASGEKVSFASVADYPDYGTIPEAPIPNEEFVNENYDFWYLMFTDDFFAGPTLGDVTGDGSVTLSDTLLAAQFAARIQIPFEWQYQKADLNHSGMIEFADIIAIAKKAIQQG